MADIPSYYHPGSRISLRLASGSVTMTIIKFFTPFSQSQVLLVQPDKGAPKHLPHPLIVKVYDSRYLKGRSESKDIPPWSYKSEAEAIRRKPQVDPDYDFCAYPEDDDAVGWEIRYYQRVENSFLSESESYKRLESLQGNGIPRCYGSGRLYLEGRPYFPHVLLLEYISDAINIRDYDKLDRTRTKPIPFSVMQSLINTVYAFKDHGIAHTDLNDGNILLTPSVNPTRGVIIDFGEAYCRPPHESDEEWKDTIHEFWDVGCTIKFLRKRPEFRDSLWPPGIDHRSF